jgi:hypothetical protein
MRTKLLCIGLIFSTSVASACTVGIGRLESNTPVSLGPNVYSAIQSTPAIINTILNARDAWNVTSAAGRIGGWSGSVTATDCPLGPMQIGALMFDSGSCSVANSLIDRDGTLAFVEYSTRSVTVNLNYVWSLTPGPYDWDLQSILVHEFGHVLGLAHQDGGICGTPQIPNMNSQTCAASPGRESMGTHLFQGETCMRDLSVNDINSANFFYNGGF